jgi:5-methylcytosine-specific restriction endonuclease McrA
MRRTSLRNRLKRCRIPSCTDEGICARGSRLQRETYTPRQTAEVTFDSRVSEGQRTRFLDYDSFFCAMCGTAPGDIDDLTGDPAKFHIGLIAEGKYGGKDELSNLRSLCSTCNQGAKNITSVKPPAIWLLSQIRRAGQEEQQAVLDWLLKKFKK